MTIRGAVERLPGVSNASVAVMAERLRLTLDESATSRQAVEQTVQALGFGIAERVGQRLDKSAHDKIEHDHSRHDHNPPARDFVLPAGKDAGHDSPGHVHDDTADRGKRWYQTAKGRLVIVTGLLLVLAWGVEAVAPPQAGKWAFVVACLIGLAPVARRA